MTAAGTKSRTTPKPTRDQICALIRRTGREAAFLETTAGRTPEEYFEEYSYREPEIWICALNDLAVPIPENLKTLCARTLRAARKTGAR